MHFDIWENLCASTAEESLEQFTRNVELTEIMPTIFEREKLDRTLRKEILLAVKLFRQMQYANVNAFELIFNYGGQFNFVD